MSETNQAPAAAVDTSRELGTKPVGQLFLKYSLITLVGMAAQIIMVILEGIIMGNGLGAHGLAVISIIMSIETLNLALGGALGFGVSTLAGVRLGNGDKEGAAKAFSQGFWFSAYFIVAVSVLFAVFAPQLAGFLGATPDLMADTTLFIRLFMILYPFCILGQMLCSMARVDEKPGLATWAATGSAVLAIAYLYFAVFIMHWGVAMTAFYYGISIGAWFLVIFYFVGKGGSKVFKVRKADMKLDFSIVKEVVKLGLPMFLVQAATSVYTIVVNNSLGSYGGDLNIAAFSVINGYVVYMITMVCTTATYGLQPVASYNYGAGSYKRLRKLLSFSMLTTFGALAVCCGVFALFSGPVCTLFCGGDVELAALATSCTRIVLLGCSFGLMAQMMSTYFLSVDKILLSNIMGVCRYLFFAIPAVLIMSRTLGITGVWWAQPVGDICTFLFTLIFIVYEFRRLGRIIKKEENPLEA